MQINHDNFNIFTMYICDFIININNKSYYQDKQYIKLLTQILLYYLITYY